MTSPIAPIEGTPPESEFRRTLCANSTNAIARCALESALLHFSETPTGLSNPDPSQTKAEYMQGFCTAVRIGTRMLRQAPANPDSLNS